MNDIKNSGILSKLEVCDGFAWVVILNFNHKDDDGKEYSAVLDILLNNNLSPGSCYFNNGIQKLG